MRKRFQTTWRSVGATPTKSRASAAQPADLGNAKPDWLAFAGALKNSPAFAGDPLAIQQQMRSEWR
jgi:hypothetical protein